MIAWFIEWTPLWGTLFALWLLTDGVIWLEKKYRERKLSRLIAADRRREG